MQMHNPAHPGEVLKELMGDAEVTAFAAKLQVGRTTLSRLLNGHAGISAGMALKLEAALGTTAEMWMNMQTQYDLWRRASGGKSKGKGNDISKNKQPQILGFARYDKQMDGEQRVTTTGQSYQVLERSCQVGLFWLMRVSFLARVQDFRRFSQAMALLT